MHRLCTTITGLVVWLAFTASAEAKIVEYISPHPVPHKYGGGFCNIDVAHVHNYPPGDPRLYRDINGQFYFVGDPTPFHYEGPRYNYFGAHPVVDAQVQLDHPVYCYLKGPHVHWYQPPPGAPFQLTGGAYWYVGNFPPAYYHDRPRFAEVNEAYAPLPYVRPVVDVHVAPPVVQAQVSFGGPGWGASVAVAGPSVPVIVPPMVPVPVPPVPVPVPPVPFAVVPVPPVPVPVPLPPVPVPVGVGFAGSAAIERHGFVTSPRDHGRHEGWRRSEHFPGHRAPPPRVVVGRAPIQQPLLRRGDNRHPLPSIAPQRQAPMAGRGPAPAARAPMPSHGPGPGHAPARGNQYRRH
jgi:hypothetical protein